MLKYVENVCEQVHNHNRKYATAKGPLIFCNGEFISYQTPVAWLKDECLEITSKKYSRTTTDQCNSLRDYFQNKGYTIRYVG